MVNNAKLQFNAYSSINDWNACSENVLVYVDQF